jgi:hypothetical protein
MHYSLYNKRVFVGTINPDYMILFQQTVTGHWRPYKPKVGPLTRAFVPDRNYVFSPHPSIRVHIGPDCVIAELAD